MEAPELRLKTSRTTRMAYLGLGWTFFGLGALGVFLPLLPTTPLMILALWAFARGSQRFHVWLYGHRIFGPPLQRWHHHRVIPLHAKIAAVAVMAASLLYMIYLTDLSTTAVALSGAFMAGAALYITSRPGRVPEKP